MSLREESFGALAYHFGTRRLVFLKSRALVDVLESLATHSSVCDAVDATVAATERDHYLAAIARLYDDGVVDAA